MYSFIELHQINFVNGQLLSISFDIINTIISGYTYGVWLGLSDLQNEGQYVSLSDGRRPRYINWGKGEPNNVAKIEHCAMYVFKKRGWNDYGCQNKINYVCMK